MKEIEDSELKRLIALAQTGDRAAFDELHKLFLTPIYRYIYLRVHSRELSEDLAQSVFLKVYQSLSTYRDRGKPILSYFFTIARNTIIDHVRKEKHQQTVELGELEQEPDLKVNFTEDLNKKFDAGIIEAHLKKLTAEQQEVIILKFVNDLSNGEIANLLGKTEMAVRQLQSRGLKALRQELKKSSGLL